VTTKKRSQAKTARGEEREGKKPVYHINFRVDSPYTREAFHVAAKLARGIKASSVLSSYVHRIINEAKEKHPEEFEQKLAERLAKLEEKEGTKSERNGMVEGAVENAASGARRRHQNNK
jgi:acetylglutamate kinase